MTAVIINLPYTAQGVPQPLLKRLELTPEDWRREHWHLTDPHLGTIVREAALGLEGDETLAPPVIIYPYSPVVADPWGLWARELDKPGSGQPQAAILKRTTSGRPIHWEPKDCELIIERTVKPFYEQLEKNIRERLAHSPLVLVLTLRSYGSQPFIFEKNRQTPRPQVAVGSLPGLTPPQLAELVGDIFKGFRWWPELNWPQPGGACLPPAFVNHPQVKALGLSLDRNLYMNEDNGRKTEGAKGVARILRTVFHLLDQELRRVAHAKTVHRQDAAKKSPILKGESRLAGAVFAVKG